MVAVRRLLLTILAVLLPALPAVAITIDPFYAGSYTATDLGAVPGVPPLYGGLTFKAGDPSKILIGGDANVAEGALYEIGVVRDGGGHIIGFSGTAALFADAAFNDGGVDYGPGGVLFLTRWPTNELGQTKPGSAATDKIVDLAAAGVAESPGGGSFVPGGFPGAGEYKVVSWPSGLWYTLGLASDGAGTYDVVSATLETTIGGGPEGIAYVPVGSPLFPGFSVLVAEFSTGMVAAYDVDVNGDPIPLTRRDFITDLEGAEGAVIDPVTGDFLFSTFGGGDRVIVVQGFVPPAPVPEPATLLLMGLGLGTLALIRRR